MYELQGLNDGDGNVATEEAYEDGVGRTADREGEMATEWGLVVARGSGGGAAHSVGGVSSISRSSSMSSSSSSSSSW